jgi:hypothetical protein
MVVIAKEIPKKEKRGGGGGAEMILFDPTGIITESLAYLLIITTSYDIRHFRIVDAILSIIA